MAKPANVEKVKEIQKKFSDSHMSIFADYRGLKVVEVTDLRKKLRAAGVEYRVYKNTLVKIAADNLKYSGLETVLKGPSAVTFSPDPIAPAKIMFNFAKANKALQIKGAVYNNEFLSPDKVQVFANLLSREEAITKVAVLLKSIIGGFARALSALGKKKAEEAGTATPKEETKAEEKPAVEKKD